jgi:uncharacterized protein
MSLPAWANGALTTTIRTIPFWLLPDRAVFHPEGKTLLVADVHIGKAASFRSLGVPVPSGTTQSNLGRLTRLLEQTSASSLYILGDFFHGPMANQPSIIDDLRAWRHQHRSVDVILVGGNHDAKAGPLQKEIGMAFEYAPHTIVLNPVDNSGTDIRFCLLHEPRAALRGDVDADFAFAGHWHPVQRLNGRVDSARLPCFWRQENQLILPAFGEFTGGHPAQWVPNQQVFVTDSQSVYDVTSIVADNSRKLRRF